MHFDPSIDGESFFLFFIFLAVLCSRQLISVFCIWMHTHMSVISSTAQTLLFAWEPGSLWGNEQEERKWCASGWKCVTAPPLSTLLIYLPRSVYFYRVHVDAPTTGSRLSRHQRIPTWSQSLRWLLPTRLVYENAFFFSLPFTIPSSPFNPPPSLKITASTRDAAATFGPPAEQMRQWTSRFNKGTWSEQFA